MNLSQMKIFEEIEKALNNSQSDLKNLFESKDVTIDSLWLFNSNIESLVDGSIYDVISAFKKDMKKNQDLIEAIYYLKTDKQNIVLEKIEEKYPLMYKQLDRFFELADSVNVNNSFLKEITNRLKLDTIDYSGYNKYKTSYSIIQLLEKGDSTFKNKIYNNGNMYDYLLYAEERYILSDLAGIIKDTSYDIKNDNSLNSIRLSTAIASIGTIATVRVDKQGNLFLTKENGEITINDDSKSPKSRIFDKVEAKDEYIYDKVYYPKNKERNEAIKDIISLFNKIPYITKLEIDSSVDLDKLKISLEKIHQLNLPLENGVIVRYRLTGKHNATGLYIDGLKTVVIDITKSSSVVHELTHALDFAGFFKDNKKDIVKMNSFNTYGEAMALGGDLVYLNSLVEIVARGGEAAFALMESDIGNVYKAYVENKEYNGKIITNENFFQTLLENNDSNYKIIGQKLDGLTSSFNKNVYFNLQNRTPNELYGIYQTYEKAFGFKDVLPTKVFDNIYIDYTGNNSQKRRVTRRLKEGLDNYKREDFYNVIKSFNAGYIFEMELPDFVSDVLLNTSNYYFSSKSLLIDELKKELLTKELFEECSLKLKENLIDLKDTKTSLYEIVFSLVEQGIIKPEEFKEFSVIDSLESLNPILSNETDLTKAIFDIKNQNGIFYFDESKFGNFDKTLEHLELLEAMNSQYRLMNNTTGFKQDFVFEVDDEFNSNMKIYLEAKDGSLRSESIKDAIIPFKDSDGTIKGLRMMGDTYNSLRFRIRENDKSLATSEPFKTLSFSEDNRTGYGYLTIPNTTKDIYLKRGEYKVIDIDYKDNSIYLDGSKYGVGITTLDNILNRNSDNTVYIMNNKSVVYPDNQNLSIPVMLQALKQLQRITETYKSLNLTSGMRNSYLSDIKASVDSLEKCDKLINIYEKLNFLSSLNKEEPYTIKLDYLKENNKELYFKELVIYGLSNLFEDKNRLIMYMDKSGQGLAPYTADNLLNNFSDLSKLMKFSKLNSVDRIVLFNLMSQGINKTLDTIIDLTDKKDFCSNSEKDVLGLILQYKLYQALKLNFMEINEFDKAGIDYKDYYDEKGKLYVFKCFEDGPAQGVVQEYIKNLKDKGDVKTASDILKSVEILQNSKQFCSENKDYSTLFKNAQKLIGGTEKAFAPKNMKEFEEFCKLSDSIENVDKLKDIKQIGD